MDGIVFNNADWPYVGRIDDPQGGHSDATTLMQQVREFITVNQEMKDRRIKLDLANASWVSAAVRICERESRGSRKFETVQ